MSNPFSRPVQKPYFSVGMRVIVSDSAPAKMRGRRGTVVSFTGEEDTNRTHINVRWDEPIVDDRPGVWPVPSAESIYPGSLLLREDSNA